MSLKKEARKSADRLLKAANKKKRWTIPENRQWTRAYNALRRLAGER
jgi:hypothetical protein